MRWIAHILVFAALLFATDMQGASAHNPQSRIVQSLNEGWRFDPVAHGESVAGPTYGDSRWTRIALPHTWNAGDALDKDRLYYRGIGWYRRTLNLSSSLSGKRLFLRFEAVNQVADVFVNGKLIGQHVGGYTAFAFDITDIILPENDNVIAVRVDNRHDENIPPLNADFTFYGGIYRDVWLITTDPVHIDVLDYASPGIFLDTPEISESSARVRVRGTVVNDSKEPKSVELEHRFLDPAGQPVTILRTHLDMKPGERTSFQQLSDPLRRPRLWSPGDPAVYRVKTEVRSGNKIVDAVENPLGFRWFGLSPDRRFMLNGKPLKLVGTNRHQDWHGMGNALPDAYHRRDIELVKETGFNFLRTAHYPQDRSVADAADRLGLLVWQETPIVNIISMTREFATNCERMLTEMIRQYYNHPSIVFWGYMNEVMLREPQPVPEGYYEHLTRLARRLENRLKQEDSSRLSVTAISFHEIDNGTGFGDIPDVHGMNLYFGWYYQSLAHWGTYLDSLREKRPDRVYMISEYGAGSDERVHTREPRAFDFSSEYIQNFHMGAFPQLLERGYIIGTAVWNQFDFGSSHRQDTKRGINQKGLFFYDRTPKDVWYYYRSKLLDEPVLHIGREWLVRAGSVTGDERQPIRIFTNCASVSFTLNGASIGTRSPENAFLELFLPLRPGDNHLTAEGTLGDKQARDGVVIRYEDRRSLFSSVPQSGSRIAVNAGAHYSFTDAAGVVWEWDRGFAGEQGEWGFVEGSPRRTHRSVRNTEDDPLFQAYREGDHSYRFQVPAGNYQIELGFVEPHFEESGKRIFDVVINGVTMLSRLDLSASYGRDRAVRIRTSVHVTGEAGLTLNFKSRVGAPVISSILVERH